MRKRATCHPDKVSQSKGLCQSCYDRARLTPERKKRMRERVAKWRLDNPESFRLSRREGHLLDRYNLSLSDYTRLLELQQGVCAICKEPEFLKRNKDKSALILAVDHDHKTGKIRGLLCNKCNFAVGHFEKFGRTSNKGILLYLRVINEK